MQPVIALVGRPNVGKSTLFNQLTRSRDALVADFPGLTRDRQYGQGKVGGWSYIVIDTGGLSGEAETLDAAMAEQTQAAIEEADLVLFMVDGRDGLTSGDEDIADALRRQGKPTFLCVNKSDGVGEERAMLDFYALGIDPVHAIAASLNRGVRQLMMEVGRTLGVESPNTTSGTGKSTKEKSDQDSAIGSAEGKNASESADTEATSAAIQHDIKIAFIGRPNVGKSTLINRLIGEERVIAYDQPGTTRDAVSIPFERAGKQYQLIDTAGVRRRGRVKEKVEIVSVVKTLQAIEQSNVCVMLLDGQDSVTDQDMHLLGHVINQGRALVVAVNKWDSLDADARDEVRLDLERRVEFLKFTRIHFISALKGSGVGDLFKSINKAHASAFKDLATSQLTRMLGIAVQQHQPPMAQGRRIKLRYAHQGGTNPPMIIIHGRQAGKVPKSYQRYLVNYFTKALRLFGTPLRVEFREGDNPFANRR
ncbi:MAG: ribosome biogenesis GTPase Der [Gammaproteobacteria bacterium]|nr:ribosome biogenesis GTPase Der [Gammaproteobacteria bacterium]